MDASQYRQFVPAEQKHNNKKHKNHTLAKRGLSVRRPLNVHELAKRVRRKRELQAAAKRREITLFLEGQWQGMDSEDVYTWSQYFVPTAYRFVSILCVSSGVPYETCWNMAMLVEMSEGFDDVDVREQYIIKQLLNDTHFGVYAPTDYDSMSCRDIPPKDVTWISRMVEKTFKQVHLIRQMPLISTVPETKSSLGSGTYGEVSRIIRGSDVFARKTIGGETIWALLDAGGREIALLLELRDAEHIVKIDERSPRILSTKFIIFDMELGKRSLWSQLKDNIPIEDPHKLLVDIATGIQECHRAQIMHRDLKPANIILFDRPDGSTVAKLADFGLARRKSICEDRTYTRTVCTSWYRAPELWRAQYTTAYGLGVDVFSFGIIACDVLCRGRYIARIINPIPKEEGNTDWWRGFFSGQLQTFVKTDTTAELHPYKDIIAGCVHPDPRLRTHISTVLSQMYRLNLLPNIVASVGAMFRQIIPFEVPPHSDVLPPNIQLQRRAYLEASR